MPNLENTKYAQSATEGKLLEQVTAQFCGCQWNGIKLDLANYRGTLQILNPIVQWFSNIG